MAEQNQPAAPKSPIGTSFQLSPEERAVLTGYDRSLAQTRTSYYETKAQLHAAEGNMAIMTDALEMAVDMINEKVEEIKKAHGALPGEIWSWDPQNLTFTKRADAQPPAGVVAPPLESIK